MLFTLLAIHMGLTSARTSQGYRVRRMPAKETTQRAEIRIENAPAIVGPASAGVLHCGGGSHVGRRTGWTGPSLRAGAAQSRLRVEWRRLYDWAPKGTANSLRDGPLPTA